LFNGHERNGVFVFEGKQRVPFGEMDVEDLFVVEYRGTFWAGEGGFGLTHSGEFGVLFEA
jgi:hypothetical protein